MAQSPFKSPAFLALLEKWNRLLAHEGLNEINDFQSNKWNGSPHNIHPSRQPEIIRYFEMAADLLNTFEFKNESHRQVWHLHSEGLSVRKIAHVLGRKKTSVHTIIIAIEIESGLKRG